jgi:Holliday junction resolvase RusA-like endonuclease
MVVQFTSVGRPVPKGGLVAKTFPSGKTGLFYPPQVARAAKIIAAAAQSEMERSGYPIIEGRCICRLKFFLKPTKTGKLIGDLDKLARLVFDALTGVVWADDVWVQALTATKQPVETNHAGTEVGLERTEAYISLAG